MGRASLKEAQNGESWPDRTDHRQRKGGDVLGEGIFPVSGIDNPEVVESEIFAGGVHGFGGGRGVRALELEAPAQAVAQQQINRTGRCCLSSNPSRKTLAAEKFVENQTSGIRFSTNFGRGVSTLRFWIRFKGGSCFLEMR